MNPARKVAAGTRSSYVIEACQVCDSKDLVSAMFLGYLPPVNTMLPIGQRPTEQPAYPAECALLRSMPARAARARSWIPRSCSPRIPVHERHDEDPARELRRAVSRGHRAMLRLGPTDLVVDVGIQRRHAAEQLQERRPPGARHRADAMAKVATSAAFPTVMAFFGPGVAARVRAEHGAATVVTATNVFAHIENIQDVLSGIVSMLGDGRHVHF